jgi:hypothetical protein
MSLDAYAFLPRCMDSARLNPLLLHIAMKILIETVQGCIFLL